MRRWAAVGLATVSLAVLVLLGSLVAARVKAPGGQEPAERVGLDLPDRRIQVEVLNAAGISRLAQQGTDQLRDHGFDVVHYGNASGFHADTSLVLDRVGNMEAAEAVARAIGVSRVRSEPDPSLYLDVTVILGRDWQGAGKAPPEE